MCAPPTRPGRFTCLAYRRVDVPRGTRGARTYTVPRWARGPAGGYTPTALARAYGVDPAAATTLTVAIVDWGNDPAVRRDLNRFDRQYRLPAETARSFRVVNDRGAARPLPGNDRGSATEISLDVQAVRGICHHCRILLVEAGAADTTHLGRAEDTAVRLGAAVVSNSYGAPESPQFLPRSFIAAYDHPGVVITASSGDDGYDFWDVANADPSYAPSAASFPATAAGVVSVGGTTLQLTAAGGRGSETVWNANGAADHAGIALGYPLGAGGGGCSSLINAPAWQHTAGHYDSAGCGGKRLAVDVAADADPLTGYDIVDSFGSSGWTTVGGTSLSAPLVAGLWALSGGAHGLRYPARTLYQNLRFRPWTLHDVRVGGNGWCGGDTVADCAAAVTALQAGQDNPNALLGVRVDCSFPLTGRLAAGPHPRNTQCNAAPGYDGPTGVGTPRGLGAFWSTTPLAGLAVGALRRAGRPVLFTARDRTRVRDTRIVRRVWTWGDRSTSTVRLRTVRHRYARPGRYTVRLTVVDSLGQRATAVRRITVTR